MKNLCPISNLPFISNRIENVLARRIEKHLEYNDLRGIYESLYHRRHSIETALLKVRSDFADVLDEGPIAVLIMLDLSAAFDVINHPMLRRTLDVRYFSVSRESVL